MLIEVDEGPIVVISRHFDRGFGDCEAYYQQAKARYRRRKRRYLDEFNRKARTMSLEPGDHVWYWNGQISQALDIPQSSWFPGFQGPTDYLGHGEEIYNFVIYDDQIARGQPHMRNHGGSYAWLNNNPGNITGLPGGPVFGQYPGKFNWHHFLIFPSWDVGFDAIAQLLRGPTYMDRSITDAFALYAPASDGNNPARYAQAVADALGLPTSTTIRELDDDQMVAMQNKITEIEGAIAGDTFASDSPDLPEELTALLQ